MSDDAIGFWSYAHADNQSSGEGIHNLAQDISREYDLVTGHTLHLFFDRDSIEWGEAWRQRIDESLAETTFLIPVVTPRYFNRPECRREFLNFGAIARSRGLEDSILPILYVDVPSLSEDSSDEVIALVARMQYADWRGLRLTDAKSAEYRKAVHDLTMRLVELESRLATIQSHNEIPSTPEQEGEDLSTLVNKIDAILPAWVDAVETNEIVNAQNQAAYDQYRKRSHQLQASGAKQSAITATLVRFSNEVMPLVERHLELSSAYAARSIELDPLISAALSIVTDYPEGRPLLNHIRQAVESAMGDIKKWEAVGEMIETEGGGTFRLDFYESHVRLSRKFREMAKLQRKSEKFADEGIAITARWNQQFIDLYHAE